MITLPLWARSTSTKVLTVANQPSLALWKLLCFTHSKSTHPTLDHRGDIWFDKLEECLHLLVSHNLKTFKYSPWKSCSTDSIWNYKAMSKIAFSQKAISRNYVTCFKLYLGNWMTNRFHSAAKSKVDIMISGLTQSVQHSGPKIALDFPCLYCIYLGLCVPTYHMHNNYVMYIVAMRVYFNQILLLRWLLFVAMYYGSLAQI